MKENVKKISIVSGFDCPWCWFINEEILQLNDSSYEFEWYPFILKNDVAEQGESFRETAKILTPTWTDKQIDEYTNSPLMKQTAQSLGFKWVHRDTRYNVINASVYAMYAKEQGVITLFVKEAFRQYFQAKKPEERNISNILVLEKIADKIGLEKSSVKKVLSDQKYQDLFYKALTKYPNVNSVPTFIYKNKSRSGFVSKEYFNSFLEEFTQE